MRADLADELRDLFVRLARIPSPSGEERQVADAVTEYLGDLGLTVLEDETAAVTGCDAGNLLVTLPGGGHGTVAFCSHLDTVPVDGPPDVIVESGVARTSGTTALGADDKAAVAVLLLLARDLAAAPAAVTVELLFTVGEEIGLQGAKAFAVEELRAEAVFVFDSEGVPGTAITAAPTTKRIDAEFHGVAAHAGIEPENGRSAVVAAARAIAAMKLGRLDEETTANVGLLEGGSAVNVVPEHCALQAEARSRDDGKLATQTSAMVAAITTAAAEVGVDVCVDVSEHYRGYAHDLDGPLLRTVGLAAADAGLEARFVAGGGGSDGNVFNARGLSAVTLGVGFERIHSPHESIRLERLSQLYELAHALIRAAGASAA